MLGFSLSSLPSWLQPILAPAAILGVLVLGAKVMLRHLYAKILIDFEKTLSQISQDIRSTANNSLPVFTLENLAMRNCGWPVWLVKWTLNYKKRKEVLKNL